ncbi:apolipoprotein N-acyltransferase [Nitratireductor sp. GCM10026969]|uniref:apolipoprotein N-acyltransferase n=1 Tax=Nitratireductor sp. GCM10026969 TaxID=3252645 RepID=UPI00361D3AC2
MERLAGRVILLWGWQRRLAAVFAGAVAALGLAPVDFPAAGFIAFPMLVWLLDGAVGTGGRASQFLSAFATGWWFGFGYFLAGLWWIGAAFIGPQGAAEWALPLAVLGVPAVLALFHGLAALAARLLWSGGAGRIAALAFGFGAAEWLRAMLSPGLAWNVVGFVAMPVPLFMQAAQLVGVFGVTSLAVYVFSAPALLAAGRGARLGLGLAVLLSAAFFGYGYLNLATAPQPERFAPIRIVQAGARDGDFEQVFAAYRTLTAAPGPDGASPRLILWPELAIPAVLADRPDILAALGETLGEGEVLLAGAMRDEEGEAGARRLYDSVVVVESSGAIADAADMVHFPPSTIFLKRPAGIEAEVPQPFSGGNGGDLLSLPEEMTAIPLIGSEAVVPGIAAVTEGRADLIVNPADFSRFTGTPGPGQYLRHAQLRAVEAGLPLLLATPDGISAAVDARGRIIDAFSAGRGVLDVSLPLERSYFFERENFVMGDIKQRGLTFVIFFGMLTLLLNIRGRSN